jgi:FkbM family methyltransferase
VTMELASLIDLALRRTVRLLNPNSTTSYSQEGEDLVLRRFLEERRSGFYVDVGAHHPTKFSNTHFFYELGWRGINIEPAPDAVAQFDKVRPRDINIGLGVAEAAGELTYYVFDEPALNTFDKTLKEEREARTSYRVIRTTKIRVDRLDRILQQRLPAGQAIDFMSIDVEGLDLQVLRSNDWNAHRPQFVLAEALDFNLEQAAKHPLWMYMHSVRYELVAKTLNTLFYRDAQ